jgi:hypothetical protein
VYFSIFMVVLSLGTPRPPEWRDQNIFIGLVLHLRNVKNAPNGPRSDPPRQM